MLVMLGLHLIFLHIPRTAGTSIRTHLKDNGGPHCELWGIDETHGDLAHIDLSQLSRFVVIADSSEYTVFCVVRNPLDRLVSAWRYMCVGEKGEKSVSFAAFVRSLDETDKGSWPIHARTQCDFIDDARARCEAGFRELVILRYERLDRDYKFGIIDRYELNGWLARLNGGDKGNGGNGGNAGNALNASNDKPVIDDETRGIIERLYERDYRELGYDRQK